VAYAVPSREEAYRSDRLKIIVYKDSQDPGVFWYTPPLKLYENEGKVVFYRRTRDDKVQYYFYIVPYMTDDLIEVLAGEIPGIQNKTQLKPITASRFGVQVKQFDTLSLGDKMTDDQYLNQPQLVRVTLPAAQADDFDFFIQNKPGVQANVLIHYDSERMDKYLNIELSYKEIYNAMNIGVSGQYRFTRAQIESAVTDYLSKKYFTIKSKGDIPIPEIVNKVIEECFTPYKRTDKKDKSKYPDWGDWINPPESGVAAALWDLQEATVDSLLACPADTLEVTGTDNWDPPKNNSSSRGRNGDLPWDDKPGDNKPKPPMGSSGGATDELSIQFTFKKELATSDKSFYYKQQHYVDSTEIVSIPIFLTLTPSGVATKAQITALEKKDFVVEYTNEQTKPSSPGINVGADEQYIINAVYSYSAQSAYEPKVTWYRWPSNWPSPDEDLYFRVGTGPWNKVNGRTVIKAEGIFRGELQFYLDRKKLWEKIPADYRNAKLIGIVPAIFTYQRTFPQFNVVVTGRKVELQP
jgi:hypothetical protein